MASHFGKFTELTPEDNANVNNKMHPGDARIISFESDQPQTPFAPQWSWKVGEKLISKGRVNTDSLRDYILEKEKEIIAKHPPDSDGQTGLGAKSLTARFKYYNAMEWDHPEIKNLKKEIVKFHKQFVKQAIGVGYNPPKGIRIRCWANVMRRGERIKKHLHSLHPHTYIGGHFTVACNETATIYVNPFDHSDEQSILRRVKNGETLSSQSLYPAENVVGKLTFFPNYVPHMTTPHRSDEERITMAFDLTPLASVFRDDETDLPLLNE